MPDNNVPASPPNEAPYRVQTPAGPAVVTLVSVARGVELPGGASGDRVILRSTVAGHPDVYAVFERAADPGGRWRRVTDELTLADLDTWTAHRRATSSTLGSAFESWIQRMTGCC